MLTNALQEEAHPTFEPPAVRVVPDFEAPEFQPPPAPAALEQPRAPAFGIPKHGLDWTGLRPFQVRRWQAVCRECM